MLITLQRHFVGPPLQADAGFPNEANLTHVSLERLTYVHSFS
jgi:hypothetical protein